MRGSAGNDGRGLGAIGASLLCVLTLSGCADAFVGMSMPSLPKIDEINPLAEKQEPLPGKRVAVIQQENISSNLAVGRQAHPAAAAAAERRVDPARRHRQQRAGPPCFRRHAARAPGARTPAQAPASTASSRPARSSTTTRSTRWMPHGTGLGLQHLGRARGLARLDDAAQREGPGRVRRRPGGGRRPHLCGTGFGYVVALRRQDRQASCGRRTSDRRCAPRPTAAGERVFVVTKEGQVFCLSGSDGTELWTFRGMPERASLLSNTSPAVDGDIVVVPYPTGDLVALRVSDGKPVWSESLARTRTGSSMSAMSDTARPVHRRRHGVRGRPRRAHGRHLAEDRRAPVVADGAEHPGALGRRRLRCSWSTPPDS